MRYLWVYRFISLAVGKCVPYVAPSGSLKFSSWLLRESNFPRIEKTHFLPTTF